METNIAGVIDHTLLKPDATEEDIDQLVQEALHYEFAAVSVHPYWVAYCYEQLKTSAVRVCTVIGFPLGANCTYTDRKSTRLNSSHVSISYDVFCLKKKKIILSSLARYNIS